MQEPRYGKGFRATTRRIGRLENSAPWNPIRALIIIVVCLGTLFFSIDKTAFSWDLQKVLHTTPATPIFLTLLKSTGIILVFIVWVVEGVDFWIRTVGTLRNYEKVKKSISWYIPIAVIFAFFPVVWGIMLNTKNILDKSKLSLVPFYGIENFIEMLPAFGQGVLIATITAATLTTIDTFLVTIAQTFFSIGRNFHKKHRLLQLDPRILIAFVAIFTAFSSFLLTLNNYWIFAVIILNLDFFLGVVVLNSVFYHKLWNKRFGVTNLILSIIIAHSAIAVLSFRIDNLLTQHYDMFPFIDLASIAGAPRSA